MDNSLFMPHGHCYLWTPGLVWLQALSNGLIGLSYVAIAATLAYLVHRGQYLPFKGMALAFGTFIITCGLTHFLDVYVIWEPVYWTDGAVRAVTAAASVGTALLLPPLVPKAIALARGARAAHERGVELESVVEDLATMYEKTRELERLKTEFFANVSHELRTPLALVIGPAQRLLSSSGLAEEHRRDAELIARNARTLLKHVNDLLDVSRLEAGKLEAGYRRVDLAHLVRSMASNFEGVAAERGMRYRVEAPEELTAEVDPDKVQRVLLNLLSNAFKFTPAAGSVRCSLRVERRGDSEAVVLEVADDGPGIPAAQRNVVFERFQQVDGSGTRQFGGTGLGLAIAKDFVELHGGRIEVLDGPDGGALFRVELPRKAPPGAEVARSVEESDVASQQVTQQALDELRHAVDAIAPAAEGDRPLVLVVEDNRDMNQFITESLRGEYRTENAFDGKQGLRAALASKPDLVLTDLMMPEMGGDELVAALRKRPEMDSVPIVLLTAKADDELRVRLLREGAQDYLTKPFDEAELRARVGNLITMKRARDVLQREIETQVRDLETLAREVSGRKRDLDTALQSMRVAREQAERASQLKTSFLGMVSHELRTPLATLQLQLERMRLDSEDLTADKRRLVDRMFAQSRRLAELVESLLQYTRVESGKLDARMETFDLRELVGSTVDEVRPRAEEQGLGLAFDAPSELPPMRSDPSLVHLLAINLMSNAIKFTTAGEVRVSVSAEGATYRVAVSDTGPGISPQERRRIFEPFEQLEATRRKHTPGVGLGLALVKEVTAALGGRIELETEVGRGSTFTLVLPSHGE